MSANGIWKSRYENEEGYGDTLFGWGSVVVANGNVYVAGFNLTQYFKDFDGKFVGFEVVAGLKKFKHLEVPDEKILPLVKAMNQVGIPTVNSCQGHMELRIGGYSQKRPHVFYLSAFGGLLEKNLPAGWEIVVLADDISMITPSKEAGTREELECMQEQAIELAEKLTQTTR